MTTIFNVHTYKISRTALEGDSNTDTAYVNFNRLRSHDNYMVHTYFKADSEISVYISVFRTMSRDSLLKRLCASRKPQSTHITHVSPEATFHCVYVESLIYRQKKDVSPYS